MHFRKSLVALLVVALVLGSAVSASAGVAFSDTANTKYASASNRLAALSILKGYPDGSFKPDGKITRAEFAAVGVRLLGLAQAADVSKGATQFSDVPASHWASGFINVAVSQGLIKGYPDGTFKPDNNVSYAEAIAILVRVLGYEPFLVGVWPANYIAKGAALGFTENVTFNANDNATRGDVALFSNKALEINPLEQSQAETTGAVRYQQSTKTLMEKTLNAVAAEGVVYDSPVRSDSGLNPGQIGIRLYDANGNLSGTTTTFDLDSNASDLYLALGERLKIVYKKGTGGDRDKVLSGERKNPERVVWDRLDDLLDVPGEQAGKLLTVSGTKLQFIASPTIWANFRNYTPAAGPNLQTFNGTGHPIKYVLDDNGNVAYAMMLGFGAGWENSTTSGMYVVTDVNVDRKQISAYAIPGSTTPQDISTQVFDLSQASRYFVFTGKFNDPKPADLSAIKKDSILHFIKGQDANSKDVYYLFVTNDQASGQVTKVETAAGVYYIYLGDTKVRLAGGFKDGDGRIGALNDTNYTNLLGKTVTVLKEFRGRARLVSFAGSGATTRLYGAVSKAPWRNSVGVSTAYVKLLKSDGTSATYEITKDTKVNNYAGSWTSATGDVAVGDLDTGGFFTSDTANAAGIAQGDVVRYSLDSNGKLDRITAVYRQGGATTLSAAAAAGATTISTAATVTVNDYIRIDTGASAEVRKVTAVTGAGPYTVTLDAATAVAHAAGATVTTNFNYSNVDTTNKLVTGDTLKNDFTLGAAVVRSYASAIVFNVRDVNNLSVVSPGTFADSVPTTIGGRMVDDPDGVRAEVIVVGTGTPIASQTQYAYVSALSKAAGSDDFVLTLIDKDGVANRAWARNATTFLRSLDVVSNAVYSDRKDFQAYTNYAINAAAMNKAFASGDVISYQIGSDGKVTSVYELLKANVAGVSDGTINNIDYTTTVSSINTSTGVLKIAGDKPGAGNVTTRVETSWVINSDTAVIDASGSTPTKVSLNDLQAGYTVRVYVSWSTPGTDSTRSTIAKVIVIDKK